jgi:hypothetical protein
MHMDMLAEGILNMNDAIEPDPTHISQATPPTIEEPFHVAEPSQTKGSA